MANKRVRRQPQRTCIGCQRTLPKRELVRIVRTPSGEVRVDETGKAAGRGAYLCRRQDCWLDAIRRRRIGAALKVRLSDEQVACLEAFAGELEEPGPERAD